MRRQRLLMTGILIFWAGGSTSIFPHNSRKCTIRQLVGTVKIRRGTAAVWNSARPKMSLKETDAIRTFIESEAELEINDGSLIKIGENTTVELSALKGTAAQHNTSIKILNGAIIANVKKIVSPVSTFEFETPTATAAIRGTTVGFEVSRDRTTVKVYEGKVLVTPKGSTNSVALQQYQMGIVHKGTEKVSVTKFDEKAPLPLSTDATDQPAAGPVDSVKAGADSARSVVDSSIKSIDTLQTTDSAGQSFRTPPSGLRFAISSPREGQVFSKPLIPVSGTVAPGAEVTVLSMKLPVTASGSFSGQIPIANESGDLTLEFEASLDGAIQKLTRRVVYKPEYRFVVTSPPDRQTVSTTNILIKGEVIPVNAEVSVLGRRLSVSTTGQFTGYVSIPDEEGEVALEFEVVAGGLNKSEVRKIVYKRPPDTYRPQITATVSKGCWNITVFDRTADEEITLHYEIDGDKEFKIMRPNESFCIPLENGIHSYRVYAEDREKNSSSVELLRNHPYLSTTTWLIKLRKPSGNVVIDVPPSSPAGEVSYYPIEFTIENLPQDDIHLIREINVHNKTNGKRVTLRTFTDNFVETEIELVRQRPNQIQIDVNDINNVTKSRAFQIDVR
ncbi:MAG: FecR domain-containing protein [Chitinispirillaceae bacterium]|nr:FecR domain-containing protein [Chitinispirillaceae bacterium]